jgi:hypothetical protein
MEDTLVDPAFWIDLSSMEPGDVCRKALVIHDSKEGYTVEFLNKKIICLPETRRVCWKGDKEDDGEVDPFLEFLIVHYLLNAKEIPLSKNMVAEKEFAGGTFFFQGPHSLPTRLIEEEFSGKKAELFTVGDALGARALEFGDVSFELKVLPRVVMGLIFWDQDDEFPPRCVFTFDATVERHLPFDVIWAMVTLVAKMLVDSHIFTNKYRPRKIL